MSLFHLSTPAILAACLLLSATNAAQLFDPRQVASSAPDCTVSGVNGTTFHATQSDFDILCDYDYAGGDYKAISAATFRDCIDACDLEDKCADVSYGAGNQACYMKTQLNTLAKNGGIWTARKKADSTTATVSCSDPANNNTVFAAAENSFLILCGIDYAGGDLAAVHAATFDACIAACDTDERCVDVSYASGSQTCYMKGDTTTASAANGIWTARKNVDPASIITCQGNASNNTVYKSANSSFLVLCGVDYGGGDMAASSQPTFRQCMDLCDATQGCVDVSYVGSACYLKDRITSANAAAGIWTGRKTSTKPSNPPLSCENGQNNGTIFTTPAGNEYDILCQVDYGGGDLRMVPVSNFEACLDACDAEPACVDVSFSGGACYMKDRLNSPSSSPWVWTGRYRGKAGQSDPSPTASASQSSISSVPSETACATAGPSTFLPSQDADVDRSSMDRLALVSQLVLNYAEESGDRVAQLEVDLSKQAIMIENTNRIAEVHCNASEVTLSFSSSSDLTAALDQWPESGFVLVTHAAGCNSDTARGFWEVQGVQTSASDATTITFAAAERNMTQIATKLTILYGTVESGIETFTSTVSGLPTEPTFPAATACLPVSSSASASPSSDSTSSPSPSEPTPSSTDRPLPTSLADLTPAARELYDFLMANIQLDANGNLDYHVPSQNTTQIQVAPYDPDDLSKQEQLENVFQTLGLSPPSALASEASSGLNGVCDAPTTVAKRSLGGHPLTRTPRESGARARVRRARNYAREMARMLKARDDNKGWSTSCDDMVTGILGTFTDLGGKTLQAVCGGKSLADNRDAFKCLFGGCQTPQYVVTQETTYDFTYEWQLNFPSVASWLTKVGDNRVLSCVNCGFSISSITFGGKIIVNVKEGDLSIQSAEVTPGISGVANMVVRLQSDADWSGSWSYIFDSVDLGSIAVDSAFSIKPTVLYGIGADFSTDSAVDVTAGAQFSLSNAAATLDLLTNTVKSSQNWKPAVSFTLPAFKTGASVSITPYMRWAVQLEVDLYGMINIAPSITSQTVVGLKSTYSFTAGTYNCPANTLAVNTYVNSMSGISPGDGSVLSLYNGQSASVGQCFGVPAVAPSPDEMQTLQAVGGPFCTSYINYQVPTTTSVSTRTVVVPSSTVTSWTTTQVSTTKTVTETINISYETWLTSTLAATTITVTASGKSATFPSQHFKREDLAEPTPAPAPAPVERRAIATPAVAAGWDATKMSYACKQIATGKSTVSSTVTLTTSSGITTTTATITSNQYGPLVTQRTSTTWTKDMGVTTVRTAGTVTETVLPPSSTNSCFKIKARNLPWAEGRYLRYAIGIAIGLDTMYYNGSVFYLTDTGKLVGYDWDLPSFMGTLQVYLTPLDGRVQMYDTSYVDLFASIGSDAYKYVYATCRKDADPCSKGLTCTLGSYPYMSLPEPLYMPLGVLGQTPGGSPAWGNIRWGLPTDPEYTYHPLTLEYEDVPCPAK
ncbi:kelch domain-containing protein [Phialemonium atrogriseum]|uniref:Kelch domain-containing protein n=1 Tax=Phialemonium atrogriseum TaxID=1093897 RepID=A0AAJ0BUK6_9PEZI|nr:kelch domain-containing protein [Phialemonium atrogriseum]KAK1764282.1 kelch domain-containing protein [Phialemonium atrogriseum]